MMKKTLFAITAMASLTFASAVFAETKLTIANWLPPSHPLVSEVIVPMAKKISEVTGGEVTTNILPAPLGPPPAQFDLAANGVADITFGVQGYNAGRFKTTNLAELPFLGNSSETISVAYWRTFEKMLNKAGEYDKVKVLAVFTHGPGEIFLKKGDVKSVDVLKGQKLRTGGGFVNQVVTKLGAVPVEGPSSKAYELLSQGVADGILFPFESVNSFKLIPELSETITVPGGLYNTSFFIVMNKAKWRSLTPKQQAEIDSVTGEALARMAGQMWDRADAKGIEAMKGKITISPATEEQLAAWKKQLQPAIDAQIADVSKTGIDGKAAHELFMSELAAAAK
jgi:TRAP-type C4-dicarboxylate transport system substrate-binding protein